MRTVLLLFGLVACAGGSDKGPGGDKDEVQPDPRTLVEVAPVVRGGVGDHIGASATIESDASATLVPEAQGVVTGIYAEEGDPVTKGQLLAVIASPTLDAAYQRATAELERATNDAATAERLFAQGAVSKAEVDLARQALAAARTAHEEASRTRGFTRLESPIAGTVAARNVRYGELAGVQPAFTIVDLARLRVIVNLPERDLAKVRPNLPATLTSAYDPDATGTGVVERVAPVVDPMSGTFRVTVRLDAPATGSALAAHSVAALPAVAAPASPVSPAGSSSASPAGGAAATLADVASPAEAGAASPAEAGAASPADPGTAHGTGAAHGTVADAVAPAHHAPPLRPGQFASVRIEVDRHEGVLTAPRRALVWEEGRSYVFEVVETTAEAEAKEAGGDAKGDEQKDDKSSFTFDLASFEHFFGGKDDDTDKPDELPGPWRKAKRVEVHVGYQDGDVAEILDGVTEGASIVVVGNQALRDGARVRLPSDPTVAAGDAAKPDAAAKPEAG
jgi:RND family efflux transporter MFP subunit